MKKPVFYLKKAKNNFRKTGTATGFERFKTRALYILDHEFGRKITINDLSKPYKPSVAERRKARREKAKNDEDDP
jgi:hypothetical protein